MEFTPIKTIYRTTLRLLLWLLFLPSLTVYAASMESYDSYTVQFEAYVDNSTEKTIEDIVQLPDEAFKKSPPAGYVGGYDRAIHWLKFTLYPIAEDNGILRMRIAPTYLDYLTLYIPDQQGHFLSQETGQLSTSGGAKDDRTFTFEIKNIHTPTTAYLRLETYDTHTVVAQIYTETAYHKAILIDYVLSGIYIGLLLALLFVDSIFIKWRNDLSFRAYYLFLIVSLLVFLDIQGWLTLLAPASWNVWMDYLPHIVTLVYALSLAFYYHVLFDFQQKNVSAYFWISVSYGTFVGVGFLTLVIDLYIEYMHWFVPISVCYLLSITAFAAVRALQKQKESRLLLLAVMFGLSTLVGSMLSIGGIVSGGTLLIYSYTIGSLCSILVFQSIMSRRIRHIEKNHFIVVLEKEQANRLAEKEKAEKEQKAQFLSMLSHELKTPLSVLSMGMAQQNVSENFRDHMIQAVSDMNMVIDRCAMLEKIDDNIATHIQTVNLNLLLESMIQHSMSPERIDLSYPQINAEIQTDEDWLKIILSNLIDNALKYSPSRSSVNVTLEKRKQAWCITVENTTTEILPGKAQIFDKYYRSKSAHKKTGSGLGLYIVKRLAAQLQARIEYIPIEYYNSDNKKVIFRLCLNTAD